MKLIIVLGVCLSSVFAEKNDASAVPSIINTNQTPVKIAEIKNLDLLEMTTSSINIKESALRCGNSKGIFGTYEFLKRASTGRKEVLSTLVVYVDASESSWQQYSADESFMSIEVTGREIPIWGKLHVGMSLSTLLSLMPPMAIVKGTSHYQYKGDSFIAQFSVGDGIVKKIIVSALCYEH